MKAFKDNEGREWAIKINIGSARRVREQTGHDLLNIEQGDPPLIQVLGTDAMTLAEVILAIITPQMEERDMTEDDVYDAFDGAVTRDAEAAFWDELRDFFQAQGRADRAEAVLAMRNLLKTAVAEAVAELGQAIEGLEPPQAEETPITGSTSTTTPA